MTLCKLCPLYKESAVNCVHGVGPQPAKILFIGESVGEDEERQGEPFCGVSGKLLTQLMGKAGVRRDDVRLTTVVRCRPVDKEKQWIDRKGHTHYGNRTPTLNEVYVCASTYLEKEIEETKPNVIVPVGNVACKYLSGEWQIAGYDKHEDGTFLAKLTHQLTKLSGIQRERGIERWSDKYKCKIIPIMHPTALLRGSRLVTTTIEDLKRIKEASLTKAIAERSKGDYRLIDTWEGVEWCLGRLRSVWEFAFDVESTGLDWMRDKLICVGFSWAVGTGASIRIVDQTGKLLWTDEQLSYIVTVLNEVFQDPNKIKIAHNLKFDAHFLMSIGVQYPVNAYDTMLAHHVLDSDMDHGLKTLAWTFSDMGGYEKPMDDALALVKKAKRSFWEIDPQVMAFYNSADCDCTLRLKKKFEYLMKGHPALKFFETWTADISREAFLTEREGVSVDFELIKMMYDKAGAKKREIVEQFRTLVKDPKVNPGSHKQLCRIFFEQEKLPIIKVSKKTGKPSCDEEVIDELKRQFPDNKALGLVVEYRSYVQMMGTYMEGIKDAAFFGKFAVEDRIKSQYWDLADVKRDGFVTDGKVHCDLLLHVASTSRLSCRNPNLQNVSRLSDGAIKTLKEIMQTREPTREDLANLFAIRSIFVADPGWKFLSSDLSQAELWSLFSVSKDAALKMALESEEGIHYNFASRLFKVPVKEVTSEQKTIAKRVVFGILYGQTAQALAKQQMMSEQMAQSYIDGWHQSFPAASWWLSQTIAYARQHKQVVSPFGKVRLLPSIDSPHKPTQEESERQATNHPLQNAASEVTQIAAVKIGREIRRLGLRSRRVLTIHDDNTYHVPDDELDLMKKIVKGGMESFIPELGLSMKVELEVSQRWKVEIEED